MDIYFYMLLHLVSVIMLLENLILTVKDFLCIITIKTLVVAVAAVGAIILLYRK